MNKKGNRFLTLCWSDTEALVEALDKHYPETNRTILSTEDLLKMVRGLPDFLDKSDVSTEALNHILWSWIRLVSDDRDIED